MPILDKLIFENGIQVIRPISDHVTRSLLSYLGIYHIFKENGLYIRDENSQATNFDTDKHTAKFHNNRCDVEIVPNLNPADTEWDMFTYSHVVMSNNTSQDLLNDYPIFADKKANIFLQELRVPCSVELNFNIRVKSVELAEMVYNAIYNKFMKDGVVTEFHDVMFSYPLPDAILWVLYKLYKLKEFDPAICSFQEYLKYGSDNIFDILMNRDKLTNKDNKQIVINRINSRVIGKLDFNGERPEAELENKIVDRYLIPFRYVYQFSRPNILRLSFPVMINNTVVPEFLIGKNNEMHDERVQVNHPEIPFNEYFNQRNMMREIINKYGSVKYPIFDDWILPYRNYQDLRNRFYPIFVGLLSTDTDTVTGETSLTVDLQNEIFPLIDTDVANILSDAIDQFQDNIFVGRNGIFNITIFCGDHPVSFDRISIDLNKVITVTENIDPTKIYRVVISIATNISKIEKECVYYMLDNAAFFEPILINNINYLVSNKYIKILKVIDIPSNISTTLPSNNITSDISVTLPRGSQNELQGDKYGLGQSIRIGQFIITSTR